MTYTDQHLEEAVRILQALDRRAIERLVDVLAAVRSRGGRLFFLGVGGSAGNCGHAVNDFRKLCGFVKEGIAQADLQMVLRAKTRNRAGWQQGSG